MTLSKVDKKEIAKMITIAIAKKDEAKELRDDGQDWDSWKERGIKSKSTGLIVAPEDLFAILPDGTKKTHFTYDEAVEATKELPEGWRLPTRSEWVMLAEEFGNDPKTGEPSSEKLRETLKLGLNGWENEDGDLFSQGSYGYWWSSTYYNSTNMYNLNLNTSTVDPQNYNYRYNGLSVRCVLKATS